MRYADMTERQMRRDLLCGVMAFICIILAGSVWCQMHRLHTVKAERDAWKRTAAVLEDRWIETRDRADSWEQQSNELPPYGTAQPDRGQR